MALLKLRPEAKQRMTDWTGTDLNSELAPMLDIDQSNLSRIFGGKAKPGAHFIAGCILAFGFGRLPEIFELDQ